MTDTYTQVPPDSTGDKIDASSVQQPGYPQDNLGGAEAVNTVNRQRAAIGDGFDATELAKVRDRRLSVEAPELAQLTRIADAVDDIRFLLKSIIGG